MFVIVKDKEMISVKEALALIQNNSISLGIAEVSVSEALDSYLSETVFSPINLPPFRQSAMDGFAVYTHQGGFYRIKEEIQAGDSKDIELKVGEGVRIFTGAQVPENADCVIMKEHILEKEEQIFLQKKTENNNIRIPGELIKKGALALPKGTLLNSAALAFLSGLGIAKVKINKKPSVAILITGNELESAGESLTRGKIYDSNSIMLKMLLKKAGIEEIGYYNVKDTEKDSVEVVKEALENYELLIASGGISVGDYDLMRNAFNTNGVSEKFYKINQRPGKPIYFGKKQNTLVFGLPGNPAACFINYQAYVLPAIQSILGYESTSLLKKATLENDLLNPTNKSLFLRAKVQGLSVRICENQNSAMLKSLVDANALVYIPETVKKIEKGEEVHYLEILQ